MCFFGSSKELINFREFLGGLWLSYEDIICELLEICWRAILWKRGEEVDGLSGVMWICKKKNWNACELLVIIRFSESFMKFMVLENF